MSTNWLDGYLPGINKILVDGVEVETAEHRTTVNLVGAGSGVSDNATNKRYDIDMSASIPLATATARGSVNTFGTTANLICCSDGSTAGGVWRSYVALGTAPPSNGDLRCSDGANFQFKSSSLGDLTFLDIDDTSITFGPYGAGTTLNLAGHTLNVYADTDVGFVGNPAVDCGTGAWTFLGVTHHWNEVRELGPGGTKPINVESITAHRTLVTGTDSQVQVLTPNADYNVILPAVTLTGLTYWIENQAASGSGFDLTVKAPDTSTIVTLTPDQGVFVRANGTSWVKYHHVALAS